MAIHPRAAGSVAAHGPVPVRRRRGLVTAPAAAGIVSLLVAFVVAGCFQSTATPSPRGTGPNRTVESPASAPTPTPPPGFSRTGWMTTNRSGDTATLLRDGTVLVAGGGAVDGISDAELYDPKTGTFSPTDPPSPRLPGSHTATLLSDGRVLIAGGIGLTSPNSSGPLSAAQLYDPKTGKFAPTGSMSVARAGHTATLLSDGRVLIAGGAGDSSGATAELYDPKTGKFDSTGSMTAVRSNQSATLLSDGRVLLAGGSYGPTSIASAELYDPKTGTFSPTGSMPDARSGYTTTLLADGRVLVAGGIIYPSDALGATKTLASAELYDPRTGTFGPTGSMATALSGHTASRLADGRVLIAGGVNSGGAASAQAELYDPKTGTFSPAGSMSDPRAFQTATVLADGLVLIAGGGTAGRTTLASAELYQPSPAVAPSPTPPSHFSPTGSMTMGRFDSSATLLPDGRVLLACSDVGGGPSDTPELYDPKAGTFAATGTMVWPCLGATVAVLRDGRVLVAGGVGSAGTVLKRDFTSELFDPKTGKFSLTGSMKVARFEQAGVQLADGRVLLAGGSITKLAVINGDYAPGDNEAVASAETYDPKTGAFSLTGSMTITRDGPTATLLKDGRVLIAGGSKSPPAVVTTPVASAELYDPRTGKFTATGSMGTARYDQTATLLPDGRVLMVGGEDGNQAVASAEIYDPKTGTFSPTGSLGTARLGHSATLLPDGLVLVAGGADGSEAFSVDNHLASAELYDPKTGTFSPAGSMSSSRDFHSAVLLPDGRVLMAGGLDGMSLSPSGRVVALDSAELYQP